MDNTKNMTGGNEKMKRILAILLMMALLVATVPAVAFASSTSTKGTTVYRVKTSGGNLNVRAKASATAKVVKSIKNGTPFIVLKTSGSWYKIRVLNNYFRNTSTTGWVSKKYTAKNAYAKVTTPVHGLNVRSTPIDYADWRNVLGSMPKGAKNVLVKKISGNWAYVTLGKLTGWSSIGTKQPYLTWLKK